jgi:uncharacterized protein (TIGR03437 family)
MLASFRPIAVCFLILQAPILLAQPDRRTTLPAMVPHQRASASDEGPLETSFPISGITLYLRPSAAQQNALEQLLKEQQNPASSNFHKWLAPEQYANRFGATSRDISSITTWLESEGLTIAQVGRGRGWLVASGTAAQVSGAFRTQLHRYRLNGQLHYANIRDISIPAELSGIVSGITGLNDFFPAPSPVSQVLLPDYTQNGTHYLAPDDLAVIYDITPLYHAGIDGTGQKIAIVGASRINPADIQQFQTKFNLPIQLPQTILVPHYADPGTNSIALLEANLDLQWAGAIARKASLFYVYSQSVLAAIQYVIDQNLAPVLSVSFIFGCENQGYEPFYQQLAQQANAQGITWVNGSGDNGAAGCDPDSEIFAQDGIAVTLPASIPEITAVGGTEFQDQTGSYWNNTNTATGASALSYIPEAAWNEGPQQKGLWSSGGGVSAFFQKPEWQAGPGVPSDGFRDVPDISLAAAATHDGYYTYNNGSVYLVGGTSAATPVFGGMLALLNQYQGSSGLGNINPRLYLLAQIAPSAFHDVTAGNNQVACAVGTLNCASGSLGYQAGPGYDPVTGLGSPDLFNLVQKWTAQAPSASLVIASASANPVYRQTPDSQGFSWVVGLTLTEEAGIATTLTGFTINGVDRLSTFFTNPAIAANGHISTGVGFTGLSVPTQRTFSFTGRDASGQTWSQTLEVQFLGPPLAPSIGGIANGASFQQAFAPGMVLSVFGSQFTPASQPAQAAGAVPLLNFMDGFAAQINGVFAPLYYVSPSQANLQIPYETAPGPAQLVVNNGQTTATYAFQVASSAPGIFADQNGALVPFASGKRGDVLILFITGEGQVMPSLATGTSPSSSTPVSNLPAPRLAASMTIGNVPAPVEFIGIPSGLVGITQINFQVPANAPLGPQPVVVKIGSAASPPVTLTVNP